MKPLGDSYTKNGFYYELVTRHGDLAIFKQRLRPGAGCLAYEVIKVKQCPETTMFGNLVEAHESAPGNEEWGRNGFTYPDLARARVKLKELEAETEKPKRVKKDKR